MQALKMIRFPLAIIIVASCSASQALAGCAVGQTCGDALTEWFTGNVRNQTATPGHTGKRVNTFTDAVQECIDCAISNVESGASSATSTSTSTDGD